MVSLYMIHFHLRFRGLISNYLYFQITNYLYNDIWLFSLKDLIYWLQAYSNLLRANMDGLKKKDKKSKNKKSKATQ